jgi:hypothetical protein
MTRGALGVLRWLPMLLVATTSVGCAPLTFSKDAPVDFEKYPSVGVLVESSNAAADTSYLVDELRDVSGFSVVTSDPAASVSLHLSVTLVVNEVVTTDSEGDTDVSYDGAASFLATDAGGQVVERGHTEDHSQFEFEVNEDVLDQVAFHYFPAFRL